ncbi:hypothetical protein C0992_002513 [Termitomyces sp. T32_za158]|nr:hypothetical protein C0992_002513 [Termitomyces sp. T32_za158]
MSAEHRKATLRKVEIALDDTDDIRSREAQVQAQAQGLRAGAASDDPYGEHVEHGDHARLLSGTQTLEGSGRRLRDTQRVALEAEDQGADILRALRQQETIESAQDQVR